MPSAKPDRIIAVVSPRSVGRTSLFDLVEKVDARNVHQFHSAPSDITAAKTELRNLGFEVLDDSASPITISIAGSRKLFEEVFGAAFVTKKATLTKGLDIEYLVPTEMLKVDTIDWRSSLPISPGSKSPSLLH